MTNRKILAVDIGTRKTKVFSASLVGSDVIVNGSAELFTEGFTRGMLTDAKLLASVIHEVIECADYATDSTNSEIHLGIGGMGIRTFNSIGSIALKSKNVIQQADIERAFKAAVLAGVGEEFQVIHIIPNTYWLDKEPCAHAPINCRGTHLEVQVHIVAVPSGDYHGLLGALAVCGIEVSSLSANVITGAEYLLERINCACGLYLDIGDGTVDMALLQEGTVVWSNSVSFGGGYIVRDLMMSLELDQAEAESLLRYYAKLDGAAENMEVPLYDSQSGITGRTVTYGFLRTVIESRVHEIVQMISSYVEPLLVSKPLQTIYFTGGCAGLPSFVQGIQQHFNIPLEVVYPEVPTEYASTANTACYGIVQHALKRHSELSDDVSVDIWGKIFGRIRKFF